MLRLLQDGLEGFSQGSPRSSPGLPQVFCTPRSEGSPAPRTPQYLGPALRLCCRCARSAGLSKVREGWGGLLGSSLCAALARLWDALNGLERFHSGQTDTGTSFAPHGSYRPGHVSHWGSVKQLRSKPPGFQGRQVLLLPLSASFRISPQGTPSPPPQPRGRGGPRCLRLGGGGRGGRSAEPVLAAGRAPSPPPARGLTSSAEAAAQRAAPPPRHDKSPRCPPRPRPRGAAPGGGYGEGARLPNGGETRRAVSQLPPPRALLGSHRQHPHRRVPSRSASGWEPSTGAGRLRHCLLRKDGRGGYGQPGALPTPQHEEIKPFIGRQGSGCCSVKATVVPAEEPVQPSTFGRGKQLPQLGTAVPLPSSPTPTESLSIATVSTTLPFSRAQLSSKGPICRTAGNIWENG